MSGTQRHNLPKQSTAFVGRERELHSLAQLLTTPGVALVTILAPGGMGKTRFALAVAEQQIAFFADGVFFVPLAPLSSASDLVTTIAEHIGLTFDGSAPPQDQLLNFLRDRSLLLVLDNFEHLLDGVTLVSEILRVASSVKLLVTSREKLNLSGETVFVLAGLSVPEEGISTDVLEHDAVRVFLLNVGQARPDFEVQPKDLRALARIAQLTGGMPLALVLAAGWLDALSLDRVVHELEQGIDILETELRDVPERQRSVRATFDQTWKYLSAEEQRAYSKLSVFRGGFTPEAAQAVAQADLRLLRRLVNKALVQVLPTGRYTVHELLRQYGEEKLKTSEQLSETAYDWHAAYFADFMQWQWTRLMSFEQLTALNEIETELDNIITAWRFMIETRKAADLRKAAICLFYFLDMRGRFQQALDLFGQSAEIFRSAPRDDENQIVLGTLLARQAWFYVSTGVPEKAKPLADEGLALLRHYGSPEDIMEALKSVIRIGTYLNQWTQSKQAAEEGLTLARTIGDLWQVETFLYWTAQCSRALHDYASAQQMGKEGLEIAEARGDLWFIAAHSGMVLGIIARERQDYPEAKRRFERSIELLELIGQRWMIAVNYGQLGDVALAMKDFALARRCYQRRLILFAETGPQTWETVRTLFSIATLLTAQGSPEQAVEILALYLQHPATLKIHREEAAPLTAQLQADLSPEVFVAAWERGKARPLDEVVRDLLERWKPAENESEPAPAQTANRLLVEPLSERELEILELIADGASNGEIAAQLVIGMSTVKKHINHIFGKLGADNRAQAIACARTLHLL